MTLNGTLSFLENRLSPDRLFVEVGEDRPTVEAARFGLEALDSFSDSLRGVGGATADFLAACRSPEGGFTTNQEEAEAELASTYYAVRLFLLRLIPGSLPEPSNTVAWVRDSILDGREIRHGMDVDKLYYAVRAIQLILSPRQLPSDLHRAVVDFMLQCASSSGGFGPMPNLPADIERTYCCVHLLHSLGEVRQTKLHVMWIGSCFSHGQAFWGPEGTRTDPSIFYWGLRAASLSGASVPWRDAARHLETFRCSDGGYGADGRSQLWHTYCCIKAHEIAAEKGRTDATYS